MVGKILHLRQQCHFCPDKIVICLKRYDCPDQQSGVWRTLKRLNLSRGCPAPGRDDQPGPGGFMAARIDATTVEVRASRPPGPYRGNGRQLGRPGQEAGRCRQPSARPRPPCP
jgi:hypothetical protein